ncbi:hypothetical protein IAD21_05719 [Abditibacteriota bacterium]|nr:hypothetical protein IAD21_05719 [Abditibacteriota bacterium]
MAPELATLFARGSGASPVYDSIKIVAGLSLTKLGHATLTLRHYCFPTKLIARNSDLLYTVLDDIRVLKLENMSGYVR